MTGWQSATPGLVVWREDSPANNPCGHSYPDDQEFWSVWHEPRHCGSPLMGYPDPESIMRAAEALGDYGDWTVPRWPDDAPRRPIEILDDLDARGL
jgi:hypothetical protein